METIKYKLAQLIRFVGDAFFYPYFALYLSSIGKIESEIGLILMILPLVGTLINPLWSLFAKNVNSNKVFIIILTFLEGLVIVYLTFVTTIPLIVLGVFLLAVVGQPFYVLFDGYTAIYTMQSNTTYSNIRLYGSLGYAIGVLIAGYLTKEVGYQYVFYGTSFFFMMLSLLLYWIKPLTLQEELTHKADMKTLVNNKNYIKFALFYVISQATLFSGDAFLGTYFEFKGLGSDVFGIMMFVGVLLEIVILAIYATWGKRFKTTYVMLSIVLANVIRFMVFSVDVGNAMLIAISFIRAFTMAGLLYIGIEYMGLNVSKKNITLGIMLYSSLRLLMQAALVFGGGYFIVSFGYYTFYLGMTILSALAFLFIDYKPKHDIINS